MKFLAINTANKQSDFVLNIDNNVFEKKMSAMEKHSESAMIGIADLFTQANQKVSNLDAIAVVVGPGSFTGIRIGISLALGFQTAFSHLKFIEITAFEYLKLQFLKDNPNNINNFTCVFNALSGKYFLQGFNKNGMPLSNPEMVENLDFLNSDFTLVGLEEENLDFVHFKVVLQPNVLNSIAKDKFENEMFSENLVPLYLRKSQAEDMLEKKENK
jgi:tRNA threonylcarbamoyl adenosine modification protein YeaZ